MADNGKKSPDFSIIDKAFSLNRPNSIRAGIPTVVWEVGYSETKAKLANDCGRWLTLCNGGVQLANAIDISYTGKGMGPQVATLTWTFWELEVEFPDDVSAGQECSTLLKADPESDPPQFHSFVKLSNKKFIKYIGRATRTFKVCFFWFATYGLILLPLQILPVDPECPKTIEILYRHVFRDPPADKVDEPYYSYSVDAIRDTLNFFRKSDSSLNSRTLKRHREETEEEENETRELGNRFVKKSKDKS